MTDYDKRDVKLNLLDKEHQALVAAGQQMHRVLIWEIILSAIALALCIEVVTISPQVSIAGLPIAVSQTKLLLGLAMVITALFWRAGGLTIFGQRLRRDIARRYDSLGDTDHTDCTGFTGFMYPDLLVVLGALDTKMRHYLVEFFQQRPPKRDKRALLVGLCWLVTITVSFSLSLLLLLVPLIVDGFVAVYAWQHRTNGLAVVGIILVLAVVYVAALWMQLQTVDRDQMVRTFSEPVKAMSELAAYMQASKSPRANEKANGDHGSALDSNADRQAPTAKP